MFAVGTLITSCFPCFTLDIFHYRTLLAFATPNQNTLLVPFFPLAELLTTIVCLCVAFNGPQNLYFFDALKQIFQIDISAPNSPLAKSIETTVLLLLLLLLLLPCTGRMFFSLAFSLAHIALLLTSVRFLSCLIFCYCCCRCFCWCCWCCCCCGSFFYVAILPLPKQHGIF